MRKRNGLRFLTALGIAALLGVGVASGPAQAQTANSVFQVTATVNDICTITANNLAWALVHLPEEPGLGVHRRAVGRLGVVEARLELADRAHVVARADDAPGVR